MLLGARRKSLSLREEEEPPLELQQLEERAACLARVEIKAQSEQPEPWEECAGRQATSSAPPGSAGTSHILPFVFVSQDSPFSESFLGPGRTFFLRQQNRVESRAQMPR